MILYNNANQSALCNAETLKKQKTKIKYIFPLIFNLQQKRRFIMQASTDLSFIKLLADFFCLSIQYRLYYYDSMRGLSALPVLINLNSITMKEC